MATVSGSSGSVSWGTSIAQVTGWSITDGASVSAWASSSTSGYKNRLGGTKDWSGNFAAKYNGDAPPTPGISAALSLIISGSDGYSGAAMIESVNFQVNVDTGEVVGFTCNFGGNGVLTRPGS